MKRKIVILTFLLMIILMGCFSQEKEVSLQGQKNNDVLEALVQLAGSGKRAGIPNDAANGVKAGVYMKLSATTYSYIYVYTFDKIVEIAGTSTTSSIRTDFMDKWNNSTETESFIIVGDKAVNLNTAKGEIAAKRLLSTALTTGIDIGLSSVIQPSTMVRFYPYEIKSVPKIANGTSESALVVSGTVPGTVVTINKNIIVNKYEVTQNEFKEVMGINQSYFDGSNVGENPVECVNWFDAVMYCNKKSEQSGLTPYYIIENVVYAGTFGASSIDGATVTEATTGEALKGYRLPNSTEWEYAARGGSGSMGYVYSGSNNIDSVSWYYGGDGLNTTNVSNPDNRGDGNIGTHPVGRKIANELGLYDMSGNVWEWCNDWFPGLEGEYKMKRGGCWFREYDYCYVDYLDGERPSNISADLGFRTVRTE